MSYYLNECFLVPSVGLELMEFRNGDLGCIVIGREKIPFDLSFGETVVFPFIFHTDTDVCLQP